MSTPGPLQAGEAGAGRTGRDHADLVAAPLPGQPARRRGRHRGGKRGGHRSASIARSSGVMAVGTLASRVTGLARTLTQAYALGAVGLADAYNVANSLPNAVYNLMLGGILSSVIVPLLVSAAGRDRDRGEAYNQRMFTLLTVALLAITVAGTLAAAPLVYLYSGPVTGPELHLMVIFAYFFIPQIFFYGISSLAGAVLNARGSFAAPMWTPVVNNVVVIAVLLGFVAIAGFGVGPATITEGEVRLIGLGTTLGVAAQTAALVPALGRVGFRWRPRFDFRRAELSEIWHMAGWMFGYIATTQVGVLVTTRVANQASVLATKARVGYGAGYTPFTYAWQLFQMPYAIVGISVITALLPRMSAHAAGRQPDLVRADFSAGLRLASVIVVPSSLVLAVLGPSLAEVLLAHGATSLASARYMGDVFAALCLGLTPYTMFQLQLRVFYALHDSRTPALIGLITMIVNVGANYAALALLPPGYIVAGMGLGFGLGNLAGAALAWRLLGRRLDGLGGRTIGPSLLRMHAAAVPAAALALAITLAAGSALPPGRADALITAIAAGCAATCLYLLLARRLRVTEVAELLATGAARLRR
ncbi:MAG TPA: murein biosynthesis integral membrane protein MurJ [Streptosporangiaceae bacterium]|nr:murein biosynthesis integral membrane protein MurJ [Streptosporangiaceae bacterium]